MGRGSAYIITYNEEEKVQREGGKKETRGKDEETEGEKQEEEEELVRSATVPPREEDSLESERNLSSKETIEKESRLFVPTYARSPVVFAKGSGCKLYDVEGKEYIDMCAGIAVNALGHGDKAWVNAITEQASLLSHVSNVFHTEPQARMNLLVFLFFLFPFVVHAFYSVSFLFTS